MKSDNDLKILRHSAAHLLAHALKELHPEVKLTIGPATEEGFFYDFLPTTNLKEQDLEPIAQRMREIAERDLPIEHTEISKEKARELYKDNPFKLELIDEISSDTVGLATQGDFYDLCRGGHVKSTGKLKNFKLLGISGSYWRANREGQALQRISGTAFPTAKELRSYEKHREQALKYDHRKLGKQLDLFSFHEEGVGFPFFHPKGKKVLNIMTDYMRHVLHDFGYQEISTPMMLSEDLWKQSGHYDHYKDNMYFCEIEDKNYAVKPMNCPGAILVYREHPRSFRDLPLRLSEFGLVHRYELSGVLHGLFRVRAFTQDDGHIFCTPDQILDEVYESIKATEKVFHDFGFHDLDVYVATRPEKAMGSPELWDKATQALKDALTKANVPFKIAEGEGAFYGPKIEFHIKDSMGRTWQCATIQLDFFLPERFDLTYVASGGQKKQPVMIHRAIYGSFERFLGILLEHYKGALPFWLAPVQARVLTITDEQKTYAHKICDSLIKHGIRAEVDESSDQISAQIKVAQLQKVPWMLVIGPKEVENNTITLRKLDGKQEFGLSLEQLIERADKLNRPITR